MAQSSPVEVMPPNPRLQEPSTKTDESSLPQEKQKKTHLSTILSNPQTYPKWVFDFLESYENHTS